MLRVSGYVINAMVAKAMNLVIKLLRRVNLWKTIYFNFHYFPWQTAIHLPVFIYKRTELYKMHGRIVIDAPVKTGLIKFGAHGLGTQDLRYSRTMWEVSGILIVKGNVCIGRGSKISIGKNATLTLGEDFNISGNSEVICQTGITFGKDCLLSWDILIMDTDFHKVLNNEGKITNSPRTINIGNHVWIGCRNTILKGVTIADNTIISANSTITKDIKESHCVVGGHGNTAGIIKMGVD